MVKTGTKVSRDPPTNPGMETGMLPKNTVLVVRDSLKAEEQISMIESPKMLV